VYLSDRDLAYAIQCGKLVFEPAPERIDVTSIDVHLDAISEAKIWNVGKFLDHEQRAGRKRPELRIAQYKLGAFGGDYLIAPPNEKGSKDADLVVTRGSQVIVRPFGFLLWQTKEVVGTNRDKNADLIAFVDGKSTRARAGIVVHLTAPTIHTTWSGKITLEIANLGPFDIVLEEDDVIAQVTVARVTSPPSGDISIASSTLGQNDVGGRKN
jgi:dCTP deaminase